MLKIELPQMEAEIYGELNIFKINFVLSGDM